MTLKEKVDEFCKENCPFSGPDGPKGNLLVLLQSVAAEAREKVLDEVCVKMSKQGEESEKQLNNRTAYFGYLKAQEDSLDIIRSLRQRGEK